jgi:hypothetical protein
MQAVLLLFVAAEILDREGWKIYWQRSKIDSSRPTHPPMD